MKTFCILEQGKTINNPITLKKKKQFTTKDSDFFRLNWKTENDPNAFITQKNIYWSEGRSLLFEKVPKKYHYYVFIDEDISFHNDAVPKICNMLDKYKPISGTFGCEKIWTLDHMRQQLWFLPKILKNAIVEREAYPIDRFDLCLHFFSADYANLVFPVPYHGSGRSMHYAQWICSKLCAGKQLLFGKIKAYNNWREPHEDDINEKVHSTKIVEKFNQDTFDKSFIIKHYKKRALINITHSFRYKPNMSNKKISLQDIAKIYNINSPGFQNRSVFRNLSS